MNSKKTTIALSAALLLSVVSITGFQITEIIAEEEEDKGHTFGENVSLTGYFKFKQGDELVPFEVFKQKSGWEKAEPYVFEMQTIVGDTPYLHLHADEAQKYRSSGESKSREAVKFDVDIVISNEADHKRVLEYRECFVDAAYVTTLFDKEEGWNTSKGFSVIDVIEIECQGYNPTNPTLIEMNTNREYANTKSTLAYEEEQRSFYGN